MTLLKRVRLDVDTEIALLRRQIEELEITIKWLMAKRDERRAAHDGGEPLALELAARPRPSISGKEAAVQFLRQAGEARHVGEIHQGALALGAQITLPGLQSMMNKYAKRGVEFTKDPRPGFYGLKAFATPRHGDWR